ncbi:exopolysaccharide biosynthesis protein [Sulfitobacter sp. D35]|uniref:exopolysaccharide biosynthesis protein n=1 Tax=Sulfitobacter sp. D35 TaxID=3083252 RepID=UPI00296FC6F7|nr:exopolysaccharide biosynthesis protein [Sulfitobacter sp. D35]MDW4496464.1 exopolysaccharide biosynthesis protein [Sulfitobacter sp. D35]
MRGTVRMRVRSAGMAGDGATDRTEGIQRAAGPGPHAMPGLVDRLDDLAAGADEVTIGDLVRTFGAQGHAPLLLVAAVLMILPVGMLPGVGGALGLVIAAIGLQMLRGKRGIWLPQFIARRTLPASQVEVITDRLRPGAAWLRRRLKIRAERFSSGPVSLACVAVLLVVCGGAMLVIGAIPIASPLVGLPIAVLAFGILARDGYVVLGGYALVVVAVVSIWRLGAVVGG